MTNKVSIYAAAARDKKYNVECLTFIYYFLLISVISGQHAKGVMIFQRL